MNKAKILISFFLVMLAQPAWAGQNWVDKFLSRYRPPKVDRAASLVPGGSEQSLSERIRAGALPLTVSDTVRLMLANNLDVSVNRFTPLATQHLVESLYRPFDPTFRLSATVERNTTPSRSQLTGAPALNQLIHIYEIGYGQTLETGTSYGVDFTLNRFSSNSAFNTFSPSYTGQVRYSVQQRLLRDFGRLTNTRQIRIAKNNQQISEIAFERQVIELVTQAQHLYWDLVFARDDLKVKQRSLELAQKTLDDNRKQVEIGTLAPIEVVQAESEVATRREQQIVTAYTQDQTEDRVKKLITSLGDPALVLARVTPVDPVRRPNPTDVLTVEEAIRRALEQRPEMRQLELEWKNRDIDVAYTKNQLLPLFDVFGAYTQNGLGGLETLRAGFGPTAPIIAVNRGGLGDAFRQLFGYEFTGYSLGFSLQIPLTNKAAQAEHARATTERRLAEARLRATAQQIALEVRNAYTLIEMNRARIEAAEKARELSERRLDAEQKKFQLGASTIRFVLEEQRNVAVARTSEILALVNYTKALVDFDRAAGRTLQQNNIEIEKALVAN